MGEIIKFPGAVSREQPVMCTIYPSAKQALEKLATEQGTTFEEMTAQAAALLTFVAKETSVEKLKTGEGNDLAIVSRSRWWPRVRRYRLALFSPSSS